MVGAQRTSQKKNRILGWGWGGVVRGETNCQKGKQGQKPKPKRERHLHHPHSGPLVLNSWVTPDPHQETRKLKEKKTPFPTPNQFTKYTPTSQKKGFGERLFLQSCAPPHETLPARIQLPLLGALRRLAPSGLSFSWVVFYLKQEVQSAFLLSVKGLDRKGPPRQDGAGSPARPCGEPGLRRACTARGRGPRPRRRCLRSWETRRNLRPWPQAQVLASAGDDVSVSGDA